MTASDERSEAVDRGFGESARGSGMVESSTSSV